MSLPKIKFQELLYTVTAFGQEVVIDVETDKRYKCCTGINVLLTDDRARFSTIELDISDIELTPENFEVVRIKYKDTAPHGYDYFPANHPAAGNKIKVKYKDKGVAGTVYPYILSISLRLEND